MMFHGPKMERRNLKEAMGRIFSLENVVTEMRKSTENWSMVSSRSLQTLSALTLGILILSEAPSIIKQVKI